MISAIELKKCMASADIFGIVINKLRYEKKLYSIILLKVNKSSKVDFYCTILPLSLVVCLQIKRNRESPLDVKEIV